MYTAVTAREMRNVRLNSRPARWVEADDDATAWFLTQTHKMTHLGSAYSATTFRRSRRSEAPTFGYILSLMSPTATAHPSLSRVVREAPRWLQISSVAVVACIVPLTLKDPAGDVWIEALASAAKSALEGAVLLWAGRRRDLSQRLRHTLRLLGSVAVVSAVLALLIGIDMYGGSYRVAGMLGSRWVLISFALATVALFLYPQRAARPGAATTLALDLLIATCGLGTLTWTLLRTPFGGGPIKPLTASILVTYGVSTIGILVGVTTVILRGRAEPSRRAFWWFVAGQASYLAFSIVAQVNQAGLINPDALDFFYQCGVLPTVIGALLMRTDDARHEDGVPDLRWLYDFNPIVLFTPLALGAGLLVAVQRDTGPQALPFATALTLVSLLLAIRLLRSSRDIVRLAAAEASLERRRQGEVTSAVTRLAGGIAHEFNNLMTTVIGNAELGEMTLAPGVPAREEFVEIRAAGERAAALTRQMLQFSGGQLMRIERIDLVELVQSLWTRRDSPRSLCSTSSSQARRPPWFARMPNS